MTRHHRLRRGFTLAEIIVSLTILSVVLLGFAEVTRRFTRTNTDVTVRTLASDLATARLETIKGDRVYTSLVATYNNITETFTAAASPYKGFTPVTYAARTHTASIKLDWPRLVFSRA